MNAIQDHFLPQLRLCCCQVLVLVAALDKRAINIARLVSMSLVVSICSSPNHPERQQDLWMNIYCPEPTDILGGFTGPMQIGILLSCLHPSAYLFCGNTASHFDHQI